MAVPPTGDVTAGGIDRDHLLTGGEAGNHFNLDIAHRCLLRLGKAFHVGMAELDVALQLLRDRGDGSLDVGSRQEDTAFVLVELRRVFERLVIATGLDIVQDALDKFVDVRRATARSQRGFFQVFTGHSAVLSVDIWQE